MAVSPEYRDWIAELCEPLGPVSLRRMFGGLGAFYGETMFAIVSDDTLYLKVDEETRADYEAAGEGPFAYRRKSGRRGVMSYFRVPADVLEDADEFRLWARKAVEVALRTAQSKRNSKAKSKRPSRRPLTRSRRSHPLPRPGGEGSEG